MEVAYWWSGVQGVLVSGHQPGAVCPLGLRYARAHFMWCAHWGCALGGVRGVARRVCVVFLCVLVSSIKCSSVEAVLAFSLGYGTEHAQYC